MCYTYEQTILDRRDHARGPTYTKPQVMAAQSPNPFATNRIASELYYPALDFLQEI